MQNLDWLQELFQHMVWADRQIWDALQKFPKVAQNEDINEKLCHIHQAQGAFLQIWNKQPVDIPSKSSFNSLKNIIEWANENHTKILQFVKQVDPAKLAEEINLPWAKNVGKSLGINPQPCSMLDSMHQVIQHSAYHRGQINSLVRKSGEDPPITDYILWVLLGKPPVINK